MTPSGLFNMELAHVANRDKTCEQQNLFNGHQFSFGALPARFPRGGTISTAVRKPGLFVLFLHKYRPGRTGASFDSVNVLVDREEASKPKENAAR
jgi:hypothetical protein